MKPTVRREVAGIRRRLEEHASKKRARGAKAYLKSDLVFLGVRVPHIRSIARQETLAHPERTRATWVELVRASWKTGVHEQRSVGIALLAENVTLLRATDMHLVEELLDGADTWAHVDWLATAVAGPLVERFVGAKKRLGTWARHDNFWIRRAALLALLVPMRDGRGDFELFETLADRMLDEREFFIRKAIGWVLRDVSRRRPELVRDYVSSRVDRLSALSFREATRRLPAKMREDLERRRATA